MTDKEKLQRIENRLIEIEKSLKDKTYLYVAFVITLILIFIGFMI